ncbi:hypothetical protein [Streptomyces spiralis]|uniref:hypothetical protein n=1 Tax=Streptomyces spiralis TaxID=66376 RepID=UPI003688DC03
MDATTPGPLAPDVLNRDDLKRALAEHDFAAAFSLIKKRGGLSQNRIASACQLTPGKVSTIISGHQQVTSFEVICRIADGLRIPGRMVGLADRPWERQTETPDPQPQQTPAARLSEDATWRPTATVHLATDLTRSDLVMDRRTATRALTGAALSGAALLDSIEGWLQPAPAVSSGNHRGGRIGMREVQELEGTARAFRAWDHRFGGGLRRKAVVGQLNEVAGHLEEHQAPDVERGLFRVMAYLGGTAATIAWDSGLQQQAQSYYLLALRAAHAGGDAAFGANVLAGMARQMLYRDRPQDALELIHMAQKGDEAAGPRLRAMLHTREAWAYAAMGREAAFKRATGDAAEALGEAGPDEEPYWICYFDEAELAGVTGGRLLDLARQKREHAEEAAEPIRNAVARRGPEAGRSHALDAIGLAECHFLMGDLRGAVDHTRQAVEAAARTQSARVRAQLSQLYPYTVGKGASRPVAEARTMIRELLSN